MQAQTTSKMIRKKATMLSTSVKSMLTKMAMMRSVKTTMVRCRMLCLTQLMVELRYSCRTTLGVRVNLDHAPIIPMAQVDLRRSLID